MGRDIHMYILDEDDNVIARPFCGGYRNYEFFGQLNGGGQEEYYNYLPTKYITIDELPEAIKKDYGYGDCCYGLQEMNLTEFVEWARCYRPWIQAGWVHKKDAWLYKNKEIYPEEYQDRLYADDILEDMEFIEFTDKSNGFLDLIDFLNNQLWFSYTSDIHKYRIVYYFDT